MWLGDTELSALGDAQYLGSSGSQYVAVESVAADEALRWQRLSDGHLPLAMGEVAVSAAVGAEVGDEITVTIYPVGWDGTDSAEGGRNRRSRRPDPDRDLASSAG